MLIWDYYFGFSLESLEYDGLLKNLFVEKLVQIREVAQEIIKVAKESLYNFDKTLILDDTAGSYIDMMLHVLRQIQDERAYNLFNKGLDL